jgi:hypothetical protein
MQVLDSSTRPRNQELLLLIVMPLTAVVAHLAINAMGGYGIFRDELYYIACSKRLDLGYVDQPSLSLIILAISRWIFGDSLFAIRFVPAFVGGAVILLSGLIAREMKGSLWAIGTAMLATFMSPHHFGTGGWYSMNIFEMLWWALGAYLVVRLVNSGEGKYWYLLGLALGLGVMNKLGILWFIAGIGIGILLTPERRWLKHKEPYVAIGMIGLFFLPYVIWNMQHNFPTLEFMRNAVLHKYNSITPMDFLTGQFLVGNPIALPLWIAGLIAFFGAEPLKRYRALGIAYLVAVAILLVNGHSKAEYLAPAYPFLFAAGCVAFDRWIRTGWLRWITFAYPILLIASGIIFAPFAVPVLPVESFIAYQHALGLEPSSSEGKELPELPQFYADMFGWEEMAKTVSDVYLSLPEEERARTVVYGQDYGQASSIDYYGKKHPLPPVVSPHNSWWYWGVDQMKTGHYTTVIIIGGKIQDHLKSLGEVRVAATHRAEHSMPYENNLPIFIGRQLKRPLGEVWKQNRFAI